MYMIVLVICTLHVPNCISYKIMHITCTLYLHVLSTIFSAVPQLSTWRPPYIPQWHESDGFFAPADQGICSENWLLGCPYTGIVVQPKLTWYYQRID